MTFLERYNQETTWQGKAMIIEIYHLAMIARSRDWTITKTANHFSVSIGLVSENLRLANAIHTVDKFYDIPSRQEALRKLPKYRNGDE